MKKIFYTCLTLSIFIITGINVITVESIEGIKLRADQGIAIAQLQVGRYYESVGRPQTALKYYSLSAQQGNASAEYNLGRLYEYGIGVKANWHESSKWYTKANDQGIPLPAHQTRDEDE